MNALGFWSLTRYDDVLLALRDPRFGRKAFADLLGKADEGQGRAAPDPSLLFLDPPEHTRLRSLVNKAFVPSLVPDLRADIQQVADGLLDRTRDARAMDLIADFALPLPVFVILAILGVPPADRERFRRWTLDIAVGSESSPASGAFTPAVAAYDSIAGYFTGLIAERRRDPQPDLLTRLIEVQQHGDSLSESELLNVCSLLFVTGHQTTVNLIGNGLLSLLNHPDELRRLQDDPGLLPNAVEELLRYDSPVQRAGRMAKADIEIGGKVIPRGATVLAFLGAANRDPAQFAEPGRLDITRPENRHLAFGFGARFCLGAPLARLEGNIAIGTLVRRLPKLALTGQPLVWRNSAEVRALRELQVTF